jgi:hypothetical protein
MVFFLTFYFYFATYNNMQQAKCITKSTNVRIFGEKITHRYHSVVALNLISLPKEVPGPMPVTFHSIRMYSHVFADS